MHRVSAFVVIPDSIRLSRQVVEPGESSCVEDFSTTAPVPGRGIRRGDGLEFIQVSASDRFGFKDFSTICDKLL